MDDLISRSSLMEEIKSLQVSVTGLRADKGILAEYAKQYRESVLRIIDEHLIAFDKEAVIAELESEAERWKESGIECNDKHDLAVSEGFRRALDIVKRGGRNEDIKQKTAERDIAQSDFARSVKH